MKNLDKHIFWEDIFKKYPKASEKFSNWIDQYKKEVNWSFLFSDEVYKSEASKIKFDIIPIEMQIGILIRFFQEQEQPVMSLKLVMLDIEKFKSLVRFLFEQIEYTLN